MNRMTDEELRAELNELLATNVVMTRDQLVQVLIDYIQDN